MVVGEMLEVGKIHLPPDRPFYDAMETEPMVPHAVEDILELTLFEFPHKARAAFLMHTKWHNRRIVVNRVGSAFPPDALVKRVEGVNDNLPVLRSTSKAVVDQLHLCCGRQDLGTLCSE
ncbi:hypothetical protein TWF696_004689 [Orbilia brochopaga]|uniref:Uncharacterized protein n=1 Tax=Orbilia brochopaga TaxID=3140254 RepID=A0AAV9V7M5_9PEZI